MTHDFLSSCFTFRTNKLLNKNNFKTKPKRGFCLHSRGKVSHPAGCARETFRHNIFFFYCKKLTFPPSSEVRFKDIITRAIFLLFPPEDFFQCSVSSFSSPKKSSTTTTLAQLSCICPHFDHHFTSTGANAVCQNQLDTTLVVSWKCKFIQIHNCFVSSKAMFSKIVSLPRMINFSHVLKTGIRYLSSESSKKQNFELDCKFVDFVLVYLNRRFQDTQRIPK